MKDTNDGMENTNDQDSTYTFPRLLPKHLFWKSDNMWGKGEETHTSFIWLK